MKSINDIKALQETAPAIRAAETLMNSMGAPTFPALFTVCVFNGLQAESESKLEYVRR